MDAKTVQDAVLGAVHDQIMRADVKPDHTMRADVKPDHTLEANLEMDSLDRVELLVDIEYRLSINLGDYIPAAGDTVQEVIDYVTQAVERSGG